MKRILSIKATALLFVFLASTVGSLYAQKVAIMDAGSSGSRLFVYEIDLKKTNRINLVYPADQHQKKGSKGKALSKVANHPDSVRVFLETMTQNYKCDSIDLYILATAGMRLKSKGQADAIYSKLMNLPAVNGYHVRGAMTISGQFEGLYGWLAANYDHGKIGIASTASRHTLQYTGTPNGILEIGGASMQLAFATNKPNTDCLSRPGLNHIYCKSYLGGGADQIFINTPKGKRKYKFNLDLEDVSGMYGENATFWGLGIPVNNVLKGIQEQGNKRSYRKKINAYIHTFEDFEDSLENYHPRINSHYIKWVSNQFDLNGKLIQPTIDSSWTIGAAIDILINNVVPEAFDHEKRN